VEHSFLSFSCSLPLSLLCLISLHSRQHLTHLGICEHSPYIEDVKLFEQSYVWSTGDPGLENLQQHLQVLSRYRICKTIRARLHMERLRSGTRESDTTLHIRYLHELFRYRTHKAVWKNLCVDHLRSCTRELAAVFARSLQVSNMRSCLGKPRYGARVIMYSRANVLLHIG
jgi:hypothetical protein